MKMKNNNCRYFYLWIKIANKLLNQTYPNCNKTNPKRNHLELECTTILNKFQAV